MTIRKKRLLSLIIACAWFVTMQAQVIFRANLDEDSRKVGTALTSDMDEFQGWDLDNCVVDTDVVWKQHHAFKIAHNGHATTPALSNLKSLAVLKFYVRSVNNATTNMEIEVIGNGKLNNKKCTIYNNGWTEYTRYLYDADFETKLKFQGCEDVDNSIMLYNIVIEEYILFHESFSKLTGNGGNDGNFNGSSLTGSANYLSLDSTTNATLNATSCNNCILMEKNGSYRTASLYNPITNNELVLSFRAAGDANEAGTVSLSTSNGTLRKRSIETISSEWNTYKVGITDLDNEKNCQITFTGANYFLDDVKLYYPLTISLDETTDNSPIIAHEMQEAVNVKLTRTLTGGYWNTLCLPYTIDETHFSDIIQQNNPTQFRILYRVENNTFYFESTETVPAGTPCLVKPTTTVTNPTFKGVTIEATVPTNTTSNGYGLWGTFSPIELHTDHTHAFLSSDQRLYYPGAGKNTMNGMRAYFVLPSQAQGTRIQIGDTGEQNGIKETCDTDNSQAVYDLSGRKMRTGTLQKGLYIINGKKTIIR